jgi:short-subunit dehydrogenase
MTGTRIPVVNMNNRKTVLITGASTGIGYELAKLFHADGHNMVLVARGRERLEEVARQFSSDDTWVKTVALDLTGESAPQRLFDLLERQNTRVDILVNNAGYGKLGDFAETSLEESLGQIQLNVAALTAITRLFLVPMLEHRDGKILNVASAAGFQPGPHMAVYYATKAYVISFSEAIADEVRRQGVTVTCLCPGVTDTAFQHRAGTEGTRLFRLPPLDAATVALEGYKALMSNKVLKIFGFRNWILAQCVRFSPRSLVVTMSGKLLESKKRSHSHV